MKIWFRCFLLASILASCEGLFFEEQETGIVPIFDAFFDEISDHYSFFDVVSYDSTEAIFLQYRDRIVSNPSDSLFHEGIEEIINFLRDGHTDFYGQRQIGYDWVSLHPINRLEDVASYVPDLATLTDALSFGKIANEDIGYIHISTFSGPSLRFNRIDNILSSLRDMKAIIIDARSNGGGNSDNADLIISRFNDKKRLMFQNRRRTGDLTDFSPWSDVFSTTSETFTYTSPVFVLTNRGCFSSAEWFIAGMRTIPHVTIVGDTTGGGSGNPLFKELPNGWSLRTSNTQKLLPEGREFQFDGIYPDVPVWISEEDSIAGIDTILEMAIALANQ